LAIWICRLVLVKQKNAPALLPGRLLVSL